MLQVRRLRKENKIRFLQQLKDKKPTSEIKQLTLS